jgi:hypothetical protein
VARILGLLVLAPAGVWGGGVGAQIPDEFTNLQVLDEGVERDELIAVMRGFSLDLGVRCQYCHVGGDGRSLQGVDFASDDDPDKGKARWMMAMVRDLNARLATDLPERDEPSVEVGCKTCHRGLPRPVLLAQELRWALDAGHADSLDTVYAQAQEQVEAGMYDFREWEVNLMAQELEAEGRLDDALAVWELQARHHPASVSVHLNRGRLHELRGEAEAARAAYARVLELSPEHRGARARLEALGGGGG